jgi:hypothetical protein
MVYGVWYMVNGEWCMLYCVWCMVYGVWVYTQTCVKDLVITATSD